MKKRLISLIFFACFCFISAAQKQNPDYDKARQVARDYMQFSRLGPGYSRDMSQEIIDLFSGLFGKDAFLCWDLFRSEADRKRPPLTVAEYIALAGETYRFRQPVLEYPPAKVRIRTGNERAVVYLEKINRVMDDADQPIHRNAVRLKMDISLARERPLILDISEARHESFIRSISLGMNITAWSNVFTSLIHDPAVKIASNETYRELVLTSRTAFTWSGLAELRLTRDPDRELVFSAGVSYSQVPLWSAMSGYVKSIPDTIESQEGTLYACTAYERAPDVGETIEVIRVEVPLALKTGVWKGFYVKAGTAFGYLYGKSEVNYELSRTGGGLVTNLSTGDQYYLDPDHELDQPEYGFFRHKIYHFVKDRVFDKFYLSIQVAPGFERHYGNFGFGAEPNFTFGMNPYSIGIAANDYSLSSSGDFHSIVESIKMPAFECAFGIRVFISYVFKD
jgi:hypothetical protein